MDVVGVSVKILEDFYRMSSRIIMVFYKNYTRISIIIPLGFKGVPKDFYMDEKG